jgi:hypothetical protein
LATENGEAHLAKTADRRGAAFHEAGHATVAWALGVPVGVIEIAIGGDDAKGGAQIGSSQHLPSVDQIAIWLAGVQAQHLFSAPTHEHAGLADYAAVFNLIGGMGEEESLSARNAGFERAQDILEQNSILVETLAAALIKDLKIDQATVDLIINGSPTTDRAHHQMSMMITLAQRLRLREMNYDDEAIANMTPEQAHKLLGL